MLTDRVREQFAAVLGLPEVEPDTDFFLAGGQSLTAVRLCLAIEDATGKPVSGRDVVERPTPAALAELLAGRPAVDREPVPDREHGDPLPEEPVSAEVAWLWAEVQRRQGGTSAYTVPCLLRVRGAVDRLGLAVELVQWKHPTLRSVFVEHRGVPRMLVRDRVQPMTVIDLRGRSAEVDDVVRAALREPFDLAVGPLFRATLLITDGDGGPEHALLLVADHCVCDGRGLEIIAADLAAFAESGAFSAPAPTVGRTRPANALAYWRRQLRPAPPPLSLPVLGPRAADPRHVVGHVSLEIPAASVRAVTEAARRAHAGPFAALLSGVAHAMAGATGATEFCLGTVVDRRPLLGLDEEVGFHVATVPVRLAVDRRATPAETVGEVAGRLADAIDNSDVTFGDLVAELRPARQPGRTPWFDAMVLFYPWIRTGDTVELSGGALLLDHGQFELTFIFVEHETGLRLVVQYDRDIYARTTAEWLGADVLDKLAEFLEPAEDTGAGLFGGFTFD
ncbi:condensation domain-containing protein [Allokutzneria sp. A3M-2-11 16]|uniref:condensation domain-containing protein n=1 Tax=Allokutzneria sp. A3M-2-11 16 TaxID=2962043 RepID=UPI0020B8837A|nr:condensation domain-containing protein [Allokutzneria sp. A3M-2-11 16]MCP3803358.1 condensation domain-containing protein [Allokutzneria sp. A3M-2-11 16]